MAIRAARARTLVTIEWIAVAVLVAFFIIAGIRPAMRAPIRTDFPNYYIAARLQREGYPLDRLYEWTWIQRQKNRLGIDQPIVGYTQLTPFSAAPLIPLAGLPPMTAKRCWTLLNVGLLAFAVWFIWQSTGLGLRRVVLLTFLIAAPLRSNALLGQQYVLVLALMSASAWLWLHRRDMPAGALLALAGGLKMFPFCFGIFFLCKRQWRAFAGLIAGMAAVVAGSLLLFGIDVNRAYVVQVLPYSLRGEGNDPFSLTWNSPTALLHRLLIFEPELNPHPLAHLPGLYAVAQPLCEMLLLFSILWLVSGRANGERSRLEFGAFVAALLVVSPATGSYHLCLLVLALALCADELLARADRGLLFALVAVCGLFSLPLPSLAAKTGGWESLLGMPYLIAMMALWCVIVMSLWRTARFRQADGAKRELAYLAIAFTIAVAAGTALNLRTLRHRFDDFGDRLAAAPGQYLETAPANTSSGVLFTAMTSQGYRAGAIREGSAVYLPFAADVLHVSAAPSSNLAAAEISSGGGSTVVVFHAAPPWRIVQIIDDAAQPALSFDGRYLGYLRFERGRGSLWVRPLDRIGSDVRVSDGSLDVLEANFRPDGTLLASARSVAEGSMPNIYELSVSAGAPGWRKIVSGPARWPAVSPDGQWLAFARLTGATWNLSLSRRDGTQERAITESLCNSISPAWMADSRGLVYATDCSRGFLLTTLGARRVVP